ncbi:MAG: SMP-30/gluconolactonase/LRE family protein [Bacteroidia bacterium]
MKLLLPVLLLFFFESTFSQVVKLNTNLSFKFVEGPVWNGKGALYFSDMNASKVYKYVPGQGFSVIRSGQVTNGMAMDSTGNLLVCEQGTTNQVVRMDTLGVVKKVLVNKYNNKAFNNPNDLCMDKKGGIYFSDPTWGTQPQDKQALYYIKPTGECIRISGDFIKPNGNCLSPDKKLLYVDDSNDKNVSVFDVQPDGTAINKRVFCVLKVNPGAVSGADGMRVDANGTLYIASAVGVQVFDKNGVSIKIITIPETATNVAFGGKDLKTLYITAGTSLYSTQVDIAGNPLFTTAPVLEIFNPIVFPNPSNGIINITLTKYKSLHIYTISGQEVLSKRASFCPATIDLSSLQNGCYIVKIEDDKVVYSSKIFLLK